MSTISLRVPDSLHNAVRQMAQEEHISVNQFILLALAEKVSALKTLDYLEERARRGERGRFESALNKVADVPAPPYDATPAQPDHCGPSQGS